MIDRRSFLRSLAAGAGAALTIPASRAGAATKKVAVRLDRFDKLKPVGGWIVLKIKDREVLLVHDADDSMRAFDPVCTHMRCIVAYKPEDRRLQCPCHDSAYDLEGRVLGGPAPKPLRRYEAVLKEDTVVLTLDEG